MRVLLVLNEMEDRKNGDELQFKIKKLFVN